MKRTTWLFQFLMMLGSVAIPAHAELGIETVTTLERLPTAHPYRLYYTDVALPHLPDGKLVIIDGRSMKVEGMVSTGSFAQTTVSPDRSEIYVATTYYAKLNRGQRFEEILVYDASTLALKAEIPYPARHSQSLPYLATLRTSADGRFIYVQNASPATSIGIVDRQLGKMVNEIQTPGCFGLYPAQNTLRVATLCGDGTMLTISLSEDGMATDKQKSPEFFDPTDDALFVAPAQDGDLYYFPSFKGDIVTVNVGGEVAKPTDRWSMASASEKRRGWRPSGFQPIALHVDSGTLYAGVHSKGYEGSHKDPMQEIWVFDVKTKKRVARSKTPAAFGLAVSKGAAPRLFAYNTEHSSIIAFDGLRKLKKVAEKAGFGDTPSQLETQ